MKLAAFDIASRTGVCLMDGEAVVHVETWKSHAKRPKGLGAQEIAIEHEAEIAEEFRAHVFSILGAFCPEHVGYEEPRTRDFERTKTEYDPAAAWAGGGLRKVKQRASSNLAMVRALILCSTLIGVCQRKNIPTTAIDADTWRKAFLGYSRAPRSVKDGRDYLKKACVAQCKLIGINVPNDDAGDSVGVAWALRGLLRTTQLYRPGELFAQKGAA